MARYTGPTTRINRRFGQAIFAPSKAFERKPHPPGIHGPRLRRKISDYSTGLNEKQKLRFMYGLTEKQFRRTFDKAKAQRGVTGEVFLQMLETRLDNVIYQLGLARSRQAARQFVGHGHIQVNGHKVDIPSYDVKPGDIIEVRDRTSSRQLATRNLEDSQYRTIPAWLALDHDALRATANRLPVAEEMEQGINLQIIVEFYSR
ncbi:30S ribosomal protein S4 [Ruficoccus sp. ZRK36]|uniref:30S ribosomal protein S4 n=1 Tax=Ruficoccus sp. ZRK36 TaxID=2866311 RepID=UPI001C72D02B|nr:30S ribosomal protein S4 [Ruficoccus sp. ZRK36]QYY35842.1 30S ribosomal protein S4 [Ruficoccus sp. ZRK36]